MNKHDHLSSAKRSLLAQRLKGASPNTNGQQITSGSASADGQAPLSFSQARLWFLHQMDPERSNYNISKLLRLTGPLDAHAFKRSLVEIIRRHEVLRTEFGMLDGVPWQKVSVNCELPMPILDLEGLRPAEQHERLHAQAHELAAAPFDLSKGPMLRVTLFRLSPEEHVVHFTIHHIAYDAWSEGILVSEFGAIYEAFVRGEPSPLPDLPIQYIDFSIWQRKVESTAAYAKLLDYWTRRLSGASPAIALPYDHKRPPQRTYAGAAQDFTVSKEVSSALLRVGRDHKASTFMLLLAAFNVFLSRLSLHDDICIGTPVANRNPPEVRSLIGFFLNTLVVRTYVDHKRNFKELLEQVRESVLEDFAHEGMPFEKLVESRSQGKQNDPSPLFQVMLVMQNAPSGKLVLPSLAIEPLAQPTTLAKFDLTLYFAEYEGALLGSFEYSTEVFEHQTIARMVTQFTHLLASIATAPELPVGRLSLLEASDRHTLLRSFNATASPFPEELLVHQLFEQQVKQTPSAIAVTCNGERLSFDALNRKANRLAHRLLQMDIAPDDRIAVCMERSVTMVVALLAVLKAGAAYVPLDPDHPSDRMKFLIADCRPLAILVHPSTRSLLEGMCEPGVAVLDVEQEDLHGQHEHDPDPQSLRLNSHHLAYVIYTSGSTGMPKGVMNQHDGVVNRLLWAQAEFKVSANDRVLQKTPFGFDVSVWEFFLTLSAGARLVIARPGGHKDPLYLADVIEREEVTHVHFVPSMLQTFLQYLPSGGCTRLLQVLCSGEALTSSLQDAFFDKLPGVALHNLYGPTEAAIDVTHWRCRSTPTGATVPIGKPIANVAVYILDDFLEPVPIGVTGEIYIGGIQVARGYLNRPELTADRFVPDPFNDGAHERLYRTGDLGRYRSDGVIEFLGRNDSQIKLHGVRIEPGEIETALTRIPGVRGAAVVLYEQPVAGARLVAYVQAQPGCELASTILRQSIARSIPDYMLPSQFVVVESFPTTTNGKLDRAALPPPEDLLHVREYMAPRTSTQVRLADIWQDVLSIGRVGIHDNFFELGGHSLSAIQVTARIGTVLQRQVPLRLLFDFPTIESFSTQLEATPSGNHGFLPTFTNNEPGREKLALSYAQQRLWFIDQLHPGSAAYNMPLAIRIRGDLDTAALAAALRGIMDRHEILRASFLSREGDPYLEIAESTDLSIERSDLRHLGPLPREEAVRMLIHEHAQKPFDLTKAPLVRVSLVQTDDREHVLMLALHHIVCDGRSLEILTAELTQMYLSFCRGAPPSLPSLPVRYVDFSRWQRQQEGSSEIGRQLDYWTKQLGGAPQQVPLPYDRVRPLTPSFRGSTFSFEVDSATVNALDASGTRANCTPYMQFLAVFSVLLYRYSGQRDICVGTPVTQRTSTHLEGLVGLFLNTLVMRLDIDPEQSFIQLLEKVRSTALDAYAHPDLPFEQLLDVIRPERGATNFFNVLFVFQTSPARGAEGIPGLTFEPMSELLANAKFDLTLTVTEAGSNMGCVFEYSTDLFDETTIEAMSGHFKRLAKELADRPQQPIFSLNMLDQLEKAWLLDEANATSVSYPEDRQVQHLFEQHAYARPDACALRLSGETLSYGELNRRANYLAHRLLSLGIDPEDRVALCLPRGFDAIAAVLAVLKAGACYVAIDPTLPSERKAFLIDDCRPRALIADSPSPDLPARDKVHILEIRPDFDWSALPGEAGSSPATRQSNRNLAYLGYTSGSSGTPKAAMIEHGSVLNLVRSHIDRCGLDATDRVLQFSALSFDGAVEEIFPTLAVGATLVLRPAQLSAPDAEFFEYVLRERVTILDLPTAFWHSWVEQLDEVPGDAYANLRLVIVGGEKAEWLRWKAWCQHEYAPRCAWINTYGPTETTVVASSIRLHPHEFMHRNFV